MVASLRTINPAKNIINQYKKIPTSLDHYYTKSKAKLTTEIYKFVKIKTLTPHFGMIIKIFFLKAPKTL